MQDWSKEKTDKQWQPCDLAPVEAKSKSEAFFGGFREKSLRYSMLNDCLLLALKIHNDGIKILEAK